jgi:hypothetical protein
MLALHEAVCNRHPTSVELLTAADPELTCCINGRVCSFLYLASTKSGGAGIISLKGIAKAGGLRKQASKTAKKRFARYDSARQE